MDRKTQWICLLAGCALSVFGVKRLYTEGDWGLLIIGALIVGFSASSMAKSKRKEE